MIRSLAVAAIFLLSGCERSTLSPDTVDGNHPVIQVVIVEGFAGVEADVTPGNILRIPGYYDLSPFDSIRISFTAERMTPIAPVDHILVKVGPMCHRRDSLSALQKDFSVMFTRWDLAKPRMCAFSFFSPDPDATLQLSQLKVIGWTLQ